MLILGNVYCCWSRLVEAEKEREREWPELKKRDETGLEGGSRAITVT